MLGSDRELTGCMVVESKHIVFHPSDSLYSSITLVQCTTDLFFAGGYDGSQRLNSIECYDPSTKKWTSLSPMHTRRSAVGCATMDGKIYVVGGYDGTSSLSSVEV